MSIKFLKLHCLISLVFDAFIQLVAKEKFAVNRRVCVSMEDLKFNKKTWSKGLDPSTVSVIVGQYRVWYSIHRIIVPQLKKYFSGIEDFLYLNMYMYVIVFIENLNLHFFFKAHVLWKN